MTPIESRYDVRLAIILSFAMSAIESLALETDTDPELIAAQYLFINTKSILEYGEEKCLNKLMNNYPILDDVLD